jgi:hypothetical protein
MILWYGTDSGDGNRLMPSVVQPWLRGEEQQKIEEQQMREPLAAYTGPVRKCPPGIARGERPVKKCRKPVVKPFKPPQWLRQSPEARRWLRTNAGKLHKPGAADRRQEQVDRRRGSPAQRQAQRAIHQADRKQERTIAHNMALIRHGEQMKLELTADAEESAKTTRWSWL